MFAHAGTYSFDGEKVIHHVGVSWNEVYNGIDLTRSYKVDGNILTITNPPIRSPIDGREVQDVLVWENVKTSTQ
jgi:hypothetical protein